MAIVGAGISGLAAARELRAAGIETTTFEASARAGGVVRSSRMSGDVLEWGPQRLRLTAELRAIVRDLGLSEELLLASPDAPMYVVRGDRMHAVPRRIRLLLTTSALSATARLRVLAEPLTAPVRDSESVAGALRRKFGEEAYQVLLGPLFGGLYASDPANMRSSDSLSRLAARAGSPRSLLLLGLRLGSGRDETPRACSFRDGLGTLPAAMARDLGASLRLEHAIERIKAHTDDWMLHAAGGRYGPFSHVVLAVPADRAARILATAAVEAAERLSRLTYNRLAVVHLKASGAPIDGFGYQVAFGEPLETRGVTFNDALFGRDGIVTAFLGGAGNLRLPDWPDDRICAVAESEFQRVTGRRARTVEVSRPSVPAYDQSWAALDGLRLPCGIHLTASYLDRPGVGGAFDRAGRLARSLG